MPVNTNAWLITHREEPDVRPLFASDIEPSAQLLRVLESSTRKAHRQVNLIVRSRKTFPLAFIMNGIHPCQWIAIAVGGREPRDIFLTFLGNNRGLRVITNDDQSCW